MANTEIPVERWDWSKEQPSGDLLVMADSKMWLVEHGSDEWLEMSFGAPTKTTGLS